MLRYPFYDSLLKETHLLVAGATGSGKSVIVNGMIYTILLDTPDNAQLVLIDPKRVELIDYKDCIHTIGYASEKEEIYNLLCYTMNLCERRYKQMQAQRVKKYQGPAIYVFIDELADLLTTDKKRIQPLLQRLAQIGRAAKIKLVVCTQSPISQIISTTIKVNFDSRIALRCSCKQDSRNIIGIPDASTLPKYGQCYYKTSMSINKWIVPCYPDNELKELAALRKRKRKKILGLF